MPAGGDVILASDVATTTPVSASDVADLTITNTTAAPGSPVVGVVFTAPPSGRVRLHVSSGMRITTPATGQGYLAVQVRTGTTIGSGTLAYDGNTEPGCRCFWSPGTVNGFAQLHASAIVEGLAAGAQYNAQLVHFVQAGTTAVLMYRRVEVDPLP